ARAEARASLGESRTARGPWVLLARADVLAGDLGSALSNVDRALEIERTWKQPPFLGLQAVRGDILARMGREKEAQDAFQTEIRDFPENLDGWSRLALLHASAGRGTQLRDTLVAMPARVPPSAAYEAAARVCDTIGDEAGARLWRRAVPGRR